MLLQKISTGVLGDDQLEPVGTWEGTPRPPVTAMVAAWAPGCRSCVSQAGWGGAGMPLDVIHEEFIQFRMT